MAETYYAWMIAQKDDLAEVIVAKLIRRGFTVGPLGRQLITKHDDNPACVIAISLYREPLNDAERKEYNPLSIHDEITDIVKQVKGKFWGLVVSREADSTWNIGNVSLKAEEALLAATGRKVN